MEYLKTRQTGRKTRLIADLKQRDRCDRCPASAQAVAQVLIRDHAGYILEELPLLFCNHHLNQHEPALASAGIAIYRKDEK